MNNYSFDGVRQEIIDALVTEINNLVPEHGYVHSNLLPGRVEQTTRALIEKHPDMQVFKDNPQYADMMHFAGAIHDLGKLDIDEKILLKPTRLTDEEYAKIKEHPQLGFKRLLSVFENYHNLSKQELQLYSICKNIILQHHERGDGRGYPNGLTSKEISLEAQIMAVEDSYDAMTINRGYNNQKNHEFAKKDLKKWGIAYNQEIVDISMEAKEQEMFLSRDDINLEQDENIEKNEKNKEIKRTEITEESKESIGNKENIKTENEFELDL